MENKNTKLFFTLGIIFIGIVSRLIPHLPNFTPVAASALFAGVYLPKKYAFIVPIAIMIISDIFLGFSQSSPIIYSCFLLSVSIGILLKNNNKAINIFIAALSSSLVFYLLTNFNYWYASPLYTKSLDGLISSYIAAIPFFKYELAGNLIYTTLFFGGYNAITTFVKQKKLALNS